ncbi:small ribosomal subunit protein uS2m-like isoform X2 [Ptychodera flava]|uniref:small ribosomal subunit protein uS2m-like isoform X2 n=1 Tax=Ptychodera flava TaxID=63121 RepID=UPI00396A2D00
MTSTLINIRRIIWNIHGRGGTRVIPDILSLRKPCTEVRHFSVTRSAWYSNPALNLDIPKSQIGGDEQPLKVTHDPLQHPDFFEVSKMFTMEDLFTAKVHLGHKTGLLNAHMKKYIFGVRQKVCIIDLQQTIEHLQLALNVTAHIAYRRGIIMFINRSLQFTHLVERTARECGEFAQCRHWQGGCFTNSLKQFGLETKLPDLIILLSTQNNVFQEHTAVRDAAKMNIPTIGIVDTSSNPNLITYPVPGNDDTPEAMELYCRLFKEAILKGKQARIDMTDERTQQD